MLPRDLLYPYGDVVIALSVVLRIKRTLDSVEIDRLSGGISEIRCKIAENAAP
jgi:hypothetical protein